MKLQTCYQMMSTKYTLKAKILLYVAVIYSISILVLSLANLGQIEIIKLEASDKIYHAVCYAIMSFLWFGHAKFKSKELNFKIILIIIVLISLFGIIIEYLQLTLTDYRTFDWWDVLANFIGIILGILMFKSLQKIFNQ